jgi:hypothetical protein
VDRQDLNHQPLDTKYVVPKDNGLVRNSDHDLNTLQYVWYTCHMVQFMATIIDQTNREQVM